MLWLVVGCLALGLFPTQFIQVIDPVTQQLVASGLGATVAASGWLLAPVAMERASYGPVDLSAWHRWRLCPGVSAGAQALPRPHRGARRPGTAAFPGTLRACRTRQRASASRSGRSSTRSFAWAAELPTPFDEQPRYRVTVEDHFWHWLYLPDCRRRRTPREADRPAAAGTHLRLPALQLSATLIAVLLAGEAMNLSRLALAISGNHRGTRSCAAADGLGKPMPRLAAEQICPEPVAAIPVAAQAVQQGIDAGRARLAPVSRRTLYRVRLHGSGHARSFRRSRPSCHCRPQPTPSRWSGCLPWRGCLSRWRRWTSAHLSAPSARAAKC